MIVCELHGVIGSTAYTSLACFIQGFITLYGDGIHVAIVEHDNVDALVRAQSALEALHEPNAVQRADVMLLLTWEEQDNRRLCLLGEERIMQALRELVEARYQPVSHKPVRLFVSGDRSQVGKTTACLGLLGALLQCGYRADEIAYIKPATQCEQPQLVTRFCQEQGIACCPIGPVVFYSGFTREFLKGATESSEQLVQRAVEAVEQIGRGKRIVLVDGVGYPAVGSICGVSNARVAHALGAPVVLVGRKGVGDAIDSFNLNRCYFESHGVPVLGAIFNRFPLEGFYSLEKCKPSIQSYFEQYQPEMNVYGVLPEVALASNEPSDSTTSACNGELETEFMHHVIDIFAHGVDVRKLIDDASHRQGITFTGTDVSGIRKRPERNWDPEIRRNSDVVVKKTRQEIQQEAKRAGATGG